MRLSFFWTIPDGIPAPHVKSGSVDKDGVSPLECLLTDGGGQNFSSTIPWLETGLSRITQIKAGTADHLHWDPESWGATISRDQVRIYSLLDERCAEILSLGNFERALAGWIDFLRSPPGDCSRD